MSLQTYRLDKADRTLMQRLFEPPKVGKLSPVASLVAYSILIFWSLFVLFPMYWVIITAFKLPEHVNIVPRYLPFIDFQPSLHAWESLFTQEPNCNLESIVRHFGVLIWNSIAIVLSPILTLTPMETKICKVYQSYVNSFVVGTIATTTTMIVGSIAAYALARIAYKPKSGNILTFVVLGLLAFFVSIYFSIPWYLAAAVALALFVLLARTLGQRFKSTLGNGDILFWMISQRILPPVVVIVPVYLMFQAVGLVDTLIALIVVYVVANLPIVVWLMYDFFKGLPIELEESAQLDGATRFRIFWEIVLPLTRSGFAATTLLTLILNWNEYIFAVFLSISKAQTMPIMVAAMNAGDRGILWWSMSVVILVMIFPVIVMAIFLQRFIAKGLLLGAVKG
jgi:multiple sugar transport system permease protein